MTVLGPAGRLVRLEQRSVRAGSLGNVKAESRGQVIECVVGCAETLGISPRPLGASQGFEQVLPLLLPCSLSSQCS